MNQKGKRSLKEIEEERKGITKGKSEKEYEV